DPGAHTIDVRAPGYKPQKLTVTIGKEKDKQAVTLPDLVPEPQAKSEEKVPPPRPFWGTQRIAGAAIGGVGVAGGVVGAVFGAKALSDTNAAKAHCLNRDWAHCDGEAAGLSSTAKTGATISTVGFALGGAAAIVGTVLFVMAPSSGGEKKEHA